MKNVLEEEPIKFSLLATLKSELDKRKLLELFPHNLSCTHIGLSKLIPEKNDDGETIYRSKERIRFIEKEGNKVKVECEEYSYFLATCAFLNENGFEYKVDNDNRNLLKMCSKINYETLDDILEDLSWEPRYIDKELTPGINRDSRDNLMGIAIR